MYKKKYERFPKGIHIATNTRLFLSVELQLNSLTNYRSLSRNVQKPPGGSSLSPTHVYIYPSTPALSSGIGGPPMMVWVLLTEPDVLMWRGTSALIFTGELGN